MKRDRRRLSILYEDDEILVIDKPAGLLTIPSDPSRATFEDTVLRRAREYLGTRLPRRPPPPRLRRVRHSFSEGGSSRGRDWRAKAGPYVGVLHRLDRGTSGALALALTRAAHAAGRRLFADHRFDRRYLAIVHGVPERGHGTIRVPISSRYASGRRGVARKGQPSLPAVTHYQVLEAFGRAALVELRLETGRQHQIRAHLEHLGHPLVGERVYAEGSRRGLNAPRPMLHAWKLSFPHPLRRQTIDVEADPPRDFLDVLARIRRSR